MHSIQLHARPWLDEQTKKRYAVRSVRENPEKSYGPLLLVQKANLHFRPHTDNSSVLPRLDRGTIPIQEGARKKALPTIE